MRGNPLVSVIIPTYNRAGFVRDAVESVLQQDYANTELVVVDDGSTDFTPDVLSPFMESVHIITQENQGQAAAVNRGFRESHGDWLGVLGSDDRLYPGAISAAVCGFTGRPRTVAVHGIVDITDSDDALLWSYGIGDLQLVDCLRFHFGPASTGVLYRRDVVEREGGWDPSFPFGLDFDYWLRMGIHGTYSYVPRVLGNFRQHSGSITAGRADDEALAREWVAVVARILDRPDLPVDVTRQIRTEALRTSYISAGVILGRVPNQPGERFRIEDRVAPVMTFTPGAELPSRDDPTNPSCQGCANLEERVAVREIQLMSEREHSGRLAEIVCDREAASRRVMVPEGYSPGDGASAALSQAQSAELEHELRECRRQTAEFRERLEGVLASRSWRLTRPLRRAFGRG